MAKIIKCPTCGENVEIPPDAAGQIVPCIACGTGIKVVSKKKSQQQGGGASGLSFAGDAGGNAATAFGGAGYAGGGSGGGGDATGYTDAAGLEDLGPPSLGECAACGVVLSDPTQLVEDRGRLICPNCARKSGIVARETVNTFRPRSAEAAAAPAIEFAAPASDVVVRHGPFLRFNLAFFLGALAAAVAIGSHVYVSLHPRPVGSIDPTLKPEPALSLPPAVPTNRAWEDENRQKINDLMTEAGELGKSEDPRQLEEAHKRYRAVLDLVGQRVMEDTRLATSVAAARTAAQEIERKLEQQKTRVAVNTPAPTPVPEPVRVEPAPPLRPAPTPGPDDTRPGPGGIFAETTQPAVPEPTKSEPPPLPESVDAVTETPVLLRVGLRALAAERYELARDAFQKAARQLPEVRLNNLSAEHQLALHGWGAALIGLKQYRAADAHINRVYRNTEPTPELIVNRGIVNLSLDTDRVQTGDEVATLLTREPSEKAIILMQAMLEKWRVSPDVRANVENIIRSAEARLEAEHPGHKRWGETWVPAGEYDEFVTNATAAEALQRDVETVTKELRLAESRLKIAVDQGRDASAEEKRVAEWKDLLAVKQKSLDEIRKRVPARASATDLKPAIPPVPPGAVVAPE